MQALCFIIQVLIPDRDEPLLEAMYSSGLLSIDFLQLSEQKQQVAPLY